LRRDRHTVVYRCTMHSHTQNLEYTPTHNGRLQFCAGTDTLLHTCTEHTMQTHSQVLVDTDTQTTPVRAATSTLFRRWPSSAKGCVCVLCVFVSVCVRANASVCFLLPMCLSPDVSVRAGAGAGAGADVGVVTCVCTCRSVWVSPRVRACLSLFLKVL